MADLENGPHWTDVEDDVQPENCAHSHYADGHCASMTCWNYYSKCPKHSISGSLNAMCSRA